MPLETAPTYIFDLHCDTLDRLALHKTFPDAGFMEQDAAIPDARMSSLASNDCHIALDRMAKAQYAWCQCFAAFIPDHMPADWGWQVFCAVRDFFQSQLTENATLIEQVRDARDVRGIVDGGKCSRLHGTAKMPSRRAMLRPMGFRRSAPRWCTLWNSVAWWLTCLT